MQKYRSHPIVRCIINELEKLDSLVLTWEDGDLLASRDGGCQANTKPKNVCIALAFDFDNEDDEYVEQIQIITIESDDNGSGSKMVDAVMRCVPFEIKVCVYDATEGKSKAFWPKMAKKYPNIVCY